MFTKIIESNEAADIKIHSLENGSLIAGFEVDLFDEETFGLEQTEELLLSVLKDLPLQRTLRFVLKSEYSSSVAINHSRSKALSQIGYVENKAYIFFEKCPQIELSIFRNKVNSKNYLTDFSVLKTNGIKTKPLDCKEIENIFPKVEKEVFHKYQTIDLGKSLVSMIRLVKQSEFGIGISTLSHIKDSLPLPYSICCTVEAVPQERAETLLRRKSKQSSVGSDLKDARKYSEAQSDLEDISLNGARLFKFEWQCIIERESEAELRKDRENIKKFLEPLGQLYIEGVGALESLKSVFPGTRPHYSLIEKDSVLTAYLPITSRGDSSTEKRPKRHSLAVHRRDDSITYINIFDPAYESFSWCIFGRPGTGKSVLCNAITRSLHYDENVKIIKIDVGGSHSKETELLGGIEKTLNLNEPTGLNPFEVLSQLGNTREAHQILVNFLEVLILEEGESKITKTMKSDLERALQYYSETVTQSQSLESFLSQKLDIPRMELFQRWVGKGVYGNSFKVVENENIKLNGNRLFYFNFSKISQALDPDYAQGGLAAVMAHFNLEMLKKSQDKKKIVFIADETPFFIQKCFSFFNLSIANVRKEGHGFITIAQKSAHVVVNDDTGILDNSPNKIFFSHDGDEKRFMERTQLENSAIEKIKTLRRKQGEYSEALFRDNKGERVINVRLNKEEYWSYTSKDEDRRKYEEIKAACPSLNTQEIIKCLSL